MKRWIFVISFLIIILSFANTISFGASNIINVSMNGSNVKVKEVPVLMNGQAFQSDVPSFIFVDRTLVPIRFVAENLGAKVDWDQKTKTATVTHNSKEVKLTIDSAKVSINKDIMTLDKNSTPKLVTFTGSDARTMVPVRFISEVLGYEVGWDDVKQISYINGSDKVVDLNPEVKPGPVDPTQPILPSNTVNITNIALTKGSTINQKVSITSDNKIEYDTLFLPDSNKLIIDIKNAKLNIKNVGNTPGNIKANDLYFSSLQYSQYTTGPYTTRLVVNMTDAYDFEMVTSSDGKVTTLSFVNKIKGISKEYIDGKEAIVIEGTKGIQYNILKLNSPERIVLDLMDSSLLGETYINYDYDLGFIKGIRTSQFQGDNNYSQLDRIVRVVLDIKDGVIDPNVKIDTIGNNLIIYPEKSFWENISYTPEGLNRLISIKNLERTDYIVDYDSDKKSMEIIIHSDSINLNEGSVSVKDGFVEEIEIIRDREKTKVIVRFRKSVEYEVLSGSRDSEILVSLKRDSNITASDKTIVIDPGHGGKHPGASSPNGILEKDVNLQIGLKAESYLSALGYNVLMTRNKDEYVDNYDRAKFANANYADIYVSIHANSTTNKDIYGLEILYCPMGKGAKKTVDQYPLAKHISEGILASTGVKDRGIFQRPDLIVIREASMPAVLVEVGYLSNAEEEKLITNDEYQLKIVEGIINGIQNYFDMY